MRVDALANIRVRRPSLRIKCAHASVTDCGDQHADQHDQDDGDEVPVRQLLRDAVQGHRRNGLNEDDAIKNQVPKGQSTSKPGNGGGGGGGGIHGNGYWIMEPREMSILKRFYSTVADAR